ncbi:hypothetical protein ES703_124062 [subsurface metagenome]
MWKRYEVELNFTTQFAGSVPKHPEDIKAMLLARAPSEAAIKRRMEEGEEITPIPVLAEKVGEEVGATEEVERGYATFKKDDKGLYFESRCVRSHIKDCANILQGILGIKALKAKVANRVYVEPERIYLDRKEPDGSENRVVHAMTRKGPRSSLKTIDFVENAKLKFTLKVLEDGVIDRDILEAIFDYGGTHGMGQERSQGWGQYTYKLREAEN